MITTASAVIATLCILLAGLLTAWLIEYILRIRRERDRNSDVIDRLCGERIEDTKEREKAEQEWSQHVSTLKAINFILEGKREGMRAFLKRYGRELKDLKKQKKENDRFMNLAGASMGKVLATAQKGLTGYIATPQKALREIILLVTHTDIVFSEFSQSRSQEAERKDVLTHERTKSRKPDKSTAKKIHKLKGKGMARISYKRQRRLEAKKESKVRGD